MADFDGLRAQLYNLALEEFPNARKNDLTAMYKLLDPKPGQHVLGFGEGNGFFVPAIAKEIGDNGRYVVTDPSKDQLENLKKNIPYENLEVKVCGAEDMNFQSEFDSIWSFGCFHHLPNQEIGMKKSYQALKENGKLILCDVWRGSDLAEHFDGPVAQYCCTGHDVKFLSDTYAKTICKKAGFDPSKVSIQDLDQKWVFEKEEDIGRFIYNLHAMTLIQKDTDEEKYQLAARGCKEILGIEKTENGYELNWPLKSLVAYK